MTTPDTLLSDRATDHSAESTASTTVLHLDDAGPLFDALTSETSRRIVSALADEPSTPAVVAERIDTSLQNVGYHLDRLSDCGLVTVVGSVYSRKGREMDVYAPSAEQFVVVGSDPDPDPDSSSATRADVSTTEQPEAPDAPEGPVRPSSASASQLPSQSPPPNRSPLPNWSPPPSHSPSGDSPNR